MHVLNEAERHYPSAGIYLTCNTILSKTMKLSFKNVLVISIISILIAACNQKETKKQGTINGKFTNAANSTVYLERFDEKGEYILDSSKTDANGNFKLNDKANEKDYYALRANPNNLVFLLLNGQENIEITGDAKNLENTYTVSGSEDCSLIRELKKQEHQLSDSLNRVYENARDNMPEKKDSVGAVLQKYFATTMDAYAKDFIVKHPHSIISLSATKYLDQQKDMQVYENLLASLVKTWPDSKYVKDFESLVGDMKKVPVGSNAPEIKLNTPDGKQISLSSFKGKVVLIDFWASWCGPCRRENPHVVEMYRKFKNKNFEILGVSLDENLNSWKDAINRDGITWPQGSELKKWDSQVAKAYQVEAIPFTVLVDKEGKIIAKGLTSDELEQKLIEIL